MFSVEYSCCKSFVHCTIYQHKVDVDRLNVVKSVLADVSSVSPSSELVLADVSSVSPSSELVLTDVSSVSPSSELVVICCYFFSFCCQ